MHQDADREQHPLLSSLSTSCRKEYDDHQSGPEDETVGPKARSLPRCPHQCTNRCIDEVGKKGTCRKEPEIHGFITEGISYERNCRTDVPEEHASTDQDGPTVNTAWGILLLNSDNLSGGEFQVTRSTGVACKSTDNSTLARLAQIVVDLE